jgi:hypothetical protein
MSGEALRATPSWMMKVEVSQQNMFAWLPEQFWQFEDGRVLVNVGVAAGGFRVDIVDVYRSVVHL